MRRFVLADPSIVGGGGHYLEYALRLVGAARRLGFTPALATNRTFDISQIENAALEVLPAFRFDIWGDDPSAGRAKIEAPSEDDLRRLRFQISRMGLLWAAAGEMPHVKQYLSRGGIGHRGTARLARTIELRVLAEKLHSEDRPGEAFAGAAMEHAARRALRGARPVNFPEADALASLRASDEKADDFALAVASIVKRLDLCTGDHLFLPTMGWHDLSGLVRYLKGSARDSGPVFHLLFRRNAYDGYPSDWNRQEYAVHDLRILFANLRSADKDQRVRCYSDTVPLTEQYKRLGAPSPVTLPIPAPSAGSVRRPGLGSEIRLAYLGDARAEKGFLLLPHVLDACSGRQASRISLMVQCYLPSAKVPIEILGAMETLRRARTHRLKIGEGYFNSMRYVRELGDCDAVMILYDRSNYVARSSGIFLEALAIGRPVITTAGTWMSGLCDALSPSYHRTMLPPSTWTKSVGTGSLDWRTLSGRVLVGPETPARSQAVLSSSETAFVVAETPRGATHLWLSLSREPSDVGRYIRITHAARDGGQSVLQEGTYLLGGAEATELSIVLPVVENQRDSWIGISLAYSDMSMVMPRAMLRWVHAPGPVARTVGGVTVDPHSDETSFKLNISKGLAELDNDFAAHIHSAAYARDLLAGSHSAERLVRSLEQNAAAIPDADTGPTLKTRSW